MVVIICLGLKINTFPDIVAPVGLREQQVLLLIDLTFWTILRLQHLLVLTLKQLLIVKLEAAVMEVTLL